MIDKYLQKRGRTRPIEWRGPPPETVENVVVIPVYDELDNLPVTLGSLESLDSSQTASLAVVCIINNRELRTIPEVALRNEEQALRANQQTLRLLRSGECAGSYALGLIDASSPGHELPGKGGVGMARKIACDSVIAYLNRYPGIDSTDAGDIMLFHLDADTHVEANYLTAGDELRASRCAGGSIRFEHLPAENERQQHAIDRYELYMHHHVGLLHWAASPYAYHSIGSAIVSSVASYVRAGGMPAKRQAGEDFYFLQQLAKCGGIACLNSTTVHPSSRVSSRVPFGTGPRINQACTEEDSDALFNVPDVRSFEVIGQIVTAFSCPDHAKEIVADLPEAAQDFLEQRGMTDIIARFQKQFRSSEQVLEACHGWFDGLVTIQLIHHLGDQLWPPVPLMAGWEQLKHRLGLLPGEHLNNERETLSWWLESHAFPPVPRPCCPNEDTACT